VSLDQQIKDTLARLKCPGTDGEAVLREFANKAGVGVTVEREVEKHTCSSCGEESVLCFRCKAQETLGEQATMALPLLLPKIALMVKQWAGEALAARAARKREEAFQAQAARQHHSASPGPPPAGRQVF